MTDNTIAMIDLTLEYQLICRNNLWQLDPRGPRDHKISFHSRICVDDTQVRVKRNAVSSVGTVA